MFRKISVLLSVLLFLPLTFSLANESDDLFVSNEYFSFVMPEETKDTYNVAKRDNGIYISEKMSEKIGIGGFAFGIKIYKDPKDYANYIGYKKLGELTDKKGTVYDMVLIRPTEIQYYDRKGIKEKYNRLYEAADKINIIAIGTNKYVKDKGTKGEDLYNFVLKKYKIAIKKKWSSKKFENEDMGYMYPLLAKSDKKLADKIGYAFYDVNFDGIDELFIGDISEGKSKGSVYDVYTMVDRKTAHVLSGGSADRYFVCDDFFLCSEYSSGEEIKGLEVLFLEKNSTELHAQIKFLYNRLKNKNSPWFYSYGSSNYWRNISEKSFNRKKRVYTKFKSFDFIPLSKFK